MKPLHFLHAPDEGHDPEAGKPEELGELTVNAVRQRDYPVLQGAFLMLAIAVVFANLAAELLYGWLDPRVREA